MSPAIIRPSVRQHSIKVEICTPAIGAELGNIGLADAALDPDATAEIRARSSIVTAYEKLPDTIKQRIDGLYARHSVEHMFGAQLPIEERHAMAAKNPAAEHPVVLTHPETGEKVLFINSAFTTHLFTTHFSNFFNFEDIRYGEDFMSEAHHLMNYQTSQAAIPEYQVRLKWRTNTVAMWDNLLVQHYAVADYGNASDAARHPHGHPLI